MSLLIRQDYKYWIYGINIFQSKFHHPSLNEPLQNNQGDKLILESCNGLLKFSLLDVSAESVWAGSLGEMGCAARGFKEKIALAPWTPEHQSLGRTRNNEQ